MTSYPCWHQRCRRSWTLGRRAVRRSRGLSLYPWNDQTLIYMTKKLLRHLHDKEASSPPVTSSSNQSVSGEHDKLHKDKYTPHLPPIMILCSRRGEKKKFNKMRGDQKKPEVNFQSCAQRNQTGAKLALSKCPEGDGCCGFVSLKHAGFCTFINLNLTLTQTVNTQCAQSVKIWWKTNEETLNSYYWH